MITDFLGLLKAVVELGIRNKGLAAASLEVGKLLGEWKPQERPVMFQAVSANKLAATHTAGLVMSASPRNALHS